MRVASHKEGAAGRPAPSAKRSARRAQKRSSPATSASGSRKNKRWSQKVTDHSNALDLEPDVFKMDNPRAIAQSLLASAASSARRKATPLRSAMSMLSFYVNRAGKGLSASRKDVLARAKEELRRLAKRDAVASH